MFFVLVACIPSWRKEAAQAALTREVAGSWPADGTTHAAVA